MLHCIFFFFLTTFFRFGQKTTDVTNVSCRPVCGRQIKIRYRTLSEGGGGALGRSTGPPRPSVRPPRRRQNSCGRYCYDIVGRRRPAGFPRGSNRFAGARAGSVCPAAAAGTRLFRDATRTSWKAVGSPGRPGR